MKRKNNNFLSVDVQEYYHRRASHYDSLYHREERKEALDEAAKILQQIFSGKEVLEIACGTGYWTKEISLTSKSIHATDINDAMLAIAYKRNYPKNNVTFERADFNSLNPGHRFEALFGGFIWSHIPVEELDPFIQQMHNYVQHDGTVVFIDNNFVEGSNTPISHEDKSGNTYQLRTLPDGETFSIVKNFPDEKFIQRKLEGKAKPVNFIKLKYYWILNYKTL
ncbi:MAG TPA: class I SAM-dependent methyltransferase [Chitinophagales bacterium]|nr:class I SAM-dependent methyltransferase [Chitinophagales bacterium]